MPPLPLNQMTVWEWIEDFQSRMQAPKIAMARMHVGLCWTCWTATVTATQVSFDWRVWWRSRKAEHAAHPVEQTWAPL